MARMFVAPSLEVPILKGRRGAWKIDRLEFHSNDVFLRVRKHLGPTSKVFVVLDTGLKWNVDNPIKFSRFYGVRRHSFCKQAEEETGTPIPLIIC